MTAQDHVDQPASQPRIFKIGSTRIVEDASTIGFSVDQVRNLLKTQYPEVANATTRETTTADGGQQIEFLPQPGRKG
jgi:PRTRC genetic system protein C